MGAINTVAHNLSAMFTNRQLNITNNTKAKSTEKLSSGYKINRSADDAAGLAISEKMRRQIRGLTQGAKNIQDGISLVQVADGALNETQDILQRMNELAVKAANGTNSGEDRAYIQKEVSALKDEIDRIATTTSFNEKIFPLKSNIDGNLSVASSNPVASTNPAASTSSAALTDLITLTSPVTGKYQNLAGNIDVAGVQSIFMLSQDYQQYYREEGCDTDDPFGSRQRTMRQLSDYLVQTTVEDDAITHRYEIQDGLIFAERAELTDDNKYVFTYTFENNSSAAWRPTWDILMSSTSDKSEYQNYCTIAYSCSNPNLVSEIGDNYQSVFNYPTDGIVVLGLEDEPIKAGEAHSFSITAGPISITDRDAAMRAIENSPGINGDAAGSQEAIWIQAGPEPEQGIYINLVDASASALGISDVDVTTPVGAGKVIDQVKGALQQVSEYRSTFGAQQNRLEHAYQVNMNTVENTQYAESQIRDTDMAEEMVKFSNQNIIQQAGQTMLAQANQSNQGVLQLLQ